MVTAAVLPIKTYERAKQRLSDAVGIPDPIVNTVETGPASIEHRSTRLACTDSDVRLTSAVPCEIADRNCTC